MKTELNALEAHGSRTIWEQIYSRTRATSPGELFRAVIEDASAMGGGNNVLKALEVEAALVRRENAKMGAAFSAALFFIYGFDQLAEGELHANEVPNAYLLVNRMRIRVADYPHLYCLTHRTV